MHTTYGAESKPDPSVVVHGTELSANDSRERYREKIARITLDSMVQFVGLLDAKGALIARASQSEFVRWDTPILGRSRWE